MGSSSTSFCVGMSRPNCSFSPSEISLVVTAAQAADELLGLRGVKASFVVFPNGENVQMSARSLGEINVQVILEALGGGGNSTTAGGRVENTDVETVKTRLLEAIDAYFEK